MEHFGQIMRSYLVKNTVIIFFVVLIIASIIFQFFGLFNSLGFLCGAVILTTSFLIWTSVLSLLLLNLHKKMLSKDYKGWPSHLNIALLSIAMFIVITVLLYFASSLLFNLSSRLFLMLGVLVIYIIVLQSVYIRALPFLHINFVVSLAETKIKRVLGLSLIYQQVLLLEMSALLKLLETLMVGIALTIISSVFIKSGWLLLTILLGIFGLLGWQGAMGTSIINRKGLLAISSISGYPLKKIALLKTTSMFQKYLDLFFRMLIVGGSSLTLVFFVSPYLNPPSFAGNSFKEVMLFGSFLVCAFILIYLFRIFTDQLSDTSSSLLLGFLRRIRLNPRKNIFNLLSLSSFFEQNYLPFLIAFSLLSVSIIIFIRVSTLFWGMNLFLQLFSTSILLMILPGVFNTTPLTERLLALKRDNFWLEKRQDISHNKILIGLTLELLGYYLWILSICGAILATVWRV